MNGTNGLLKNSAVSCGRLRLETRPKYPPYRETDVLGGNFGPHPPGDPTPSWDFTLKIPPPPFRRLGLPLPLPRAENKNKKYPKRPPSVAIPLLHCVFCGIADYRCDTPDFFPYINGLSQSKDRPRREGIAEKACF